MSKEQKKPQPVTWKEASLWRSYFFPHKALSSCELGRVGSLTPPQRLHP